MGWFSKSTRHLDRLGVWYGGYAMLTGIVGWLAKQATWFGNLNWADAALIGLFGSAGLMLTVSVGLALYRFFRPLGSQADSERMDTKAAAIPTSGRADFSDNQIKELIDSRLSEFTTHAQSHAYDEKLLDQAEKVKRAQMSATLTFDHCNSEIARVDARIAEIAGGCSDLERKFNGWTMQHTDSQEQRFSWVDAGFAAIINREWHQRLFAELETSFAEIAEPINVGDPIPDPGRWQMLITNWRGKLDQWLVIADFYAMNTRENVLLIPDHLYYGSWTFAEDKLTADQVKMFKEVSIWWMTAKAAKPRVNQCLVAAAFESPSKKGRQDAPPRLNEGR